MDEHSRTKIVIDLMNKLKKFKGKNGSTIDLYSFCIFVPEFKKICNEYIRTGIPVKGILEFEEIEKKIEYSLSNKPLLVIRS
jgi:hypothetical protein